MSGVLTEQAILSKAKVQKLSDVHNLTMWGLKLVNVSIIKECTNIETLTLSSNAVESLEVLSHCKKLREVFLRKNNIQSLNELYYLRGLEKLKTLWLSDNPLAEEPDYRLFCIAVLPQLTKLDETDITPEEHTRAKVKFPSPESVVKPPASLSVAAKPAPQPQNVLPDTQHRILDCILTLLPELDSNSLDALSEQILAIRQQK